MSYKRRIVVGGVVVPAAVLAVVLSLGRSGTATATSFVLHGGTHLSPDAKAAMLRGRRADIKDAFLLSTAQGRSYYRLVRDDGAPCYAVRPAGDPSGPGTTICFGGGNPPALIDFSVYEESVAEPAIHLWRLEGLVTNGDVSRIRIAAADGRGFDVPVTNNVYYMATPPHTAVAEVDAYDSHGALVSSSKIGAGPAGSR